jgi:hypothetical protein
MKVSPARSDTATDLRFADRYTPAGSTGDHVKQLFAVEQGGFDPFDESQQVTAGVSQRHSVACPLNQRQAGERLQVEELECYRRLSEIETAGDRPKLAVTSRPVAWYDRPRA